MTFEDEIKIAINRASAETPSDTPDHILATYLSDCLAAWDKATVLREIYYGRKPDPPDTEYV